MLQKLLYLIKYIKSYLPSKLPVSIDAYHKWAEEIIFLCGKYADERSMKFAIATMVMHAESHASSISQQWFVKRLRKSAANQVASQVFIDIKTQQQAEATAQKAVVDVQPL